MRIASSHVRAGVRLLAAVVAVLVHQSVVAQPAPAVVHAGLVERAELAEHRRVTGELRPIAQSAVATIEPGIVIAFDVDEGDRVRTGQILAVLDQRRIELAIAQAAAELTVREAVVNARTAELDMEQRDLDVLLEMDQRRAANPKELADARAERDIAAAQLEEARQEVAVTQARVNLLETRRADLTITAPFDGIVIATRTEVGQWLSEGDVLVDLIAVDRWRAWLDVPERYARAVRARTRPFPFRSARPDNAWRDHRSSSSRPLIRGRGRFRSTWRSVTRKASVRQACRCADGSRRGSVGRT